jgi:hypothetical protein
MVQTPIEPMGERLVRVMGATLGDDEAVMLDPQTRAVASQHQGIPSPKKIPSQMVVTHAGGPPGSAVFGDVTIIGNHGGSRRQGVASR